MKTTNRIILMALALLVTVGAAAQMESKLTFRQYTIQDGLPQMQTERLFQDSRGYIYIGTLSGFVRFDGRTFTSFLRGRRFNIVGFAEVEGQVRAFDFRRQWLTDYDEVAMQPIDAAGRWLLNNYNSASLPQDYVLLEDEQEEHRRLCRVEKEGFRVVTRGALLDEMAPDRKLYLDTTGLYVPTEHGLYRVRRNKAFRLTTKGNVFTLLRADSMLLAFAADGIYTVGEDGLQLTTACNFSAVHYGLIVRTLCEGRIVIADEHSLYEYDGRQLRPMATGFNLVKDLMTDRWNRLWVATYEGLYCYFTRSFTTHRLQDTDDIVRAIATDSQDRVYLGTLNGKLLRDSTLIDDDADNFFVPSTARVGSSIYMVGNGDVLRIDSTGECRWLLLPHDRYQFVAPAGGRLVIGSRCCITAYDPATGRVDTLSTTTPYPWCAAQDGDGRLWVGSTFGLYVDGRKYDYHQQLIVTSMQRDRQGNILLASKDSLFLVRKGHVEPLTMQPLAGHEVRALHLSPRGFLVVAAIDGLFVARVGKDYRLTDVRFYDHTNGFTTLEPLMATLGETSDGTVWLAGIEETTSFRPAELLAYDEHDTYITPPLRWWQHWWVWLAVLLLLAMAVWAVTRWYEKRRNRQRIVRLQREKLQREEQIAAIRQKAIDEVRASELAKDIVQMTDHAFENRLTLRTASGTIVVEVKDIAYFKGEGNYSQIVTFHDKDIVLMGLGALEKMLSPEVFVRADRSTLVNIHNVCQLLPKQRRCLFRSPTGQEVETTLLAPAFKRLQGLL